LKFQFIAYAMNVLFAPLTQDWSPGLGPAIPSPPRESRAWRGPHASESLDADTASGSVFPKLTHYPISYLPVNHPPLLLIPDCNTFALLRITDYADRAGSARRSRTSVIAI